MRGYIHVVDLAKGHIKALEKLVSVPGCIAHNLGTGQGYSVIEIPFQIVDRRSGDIAACYADHSRAKANLNWTAVRGLHNTHDDAW